MHCPECKAIGSLLEMMDKCNRTQHQNLEKHVWPTKKKLLGKLRAGGHTTPLLQGEICAHCSFRSFEMLEQMVPILVTASW